MTEDSMFDNKLNHWKGVVSPESFALAVKICEHLNYGWECFPDDIEEAVKRDVAKIISMEDPVETRLQRATDRVQALHLDLAEAQSELRECNKEKDGIK